MMKMARSTYYEKSLREVRNLEKDLNLREMIAQVHLKFPGYGYRRIRHHFLRHGIIVNEKRIKRVMKKYSIFASARPKLRPRGSALGKRLVFPNLIRGMSVTAPNQLWATDFTYVRLLREYIYVNAIIDVYTRKIVGWSISRNLTHEFCLEAIKAAVKNYDPPRNITHHSDRGAQYTSLVYVSYLEEKGFKISMCTVFSQLG